MCSQPTVPSLMLKSGMVLLLRSGMITGCPSDCFYHTLRPNISVQQVFQGGFDLCLRPRLMRAAIAELDSLLAVLQDIHLQEGQDVRRLTTTQRPFSSRDAYDTLSPSPSIQDFHGRWIWQTKVPNKVNFFLHGYTSKIDSVQRQICSTKT